ncbi:33572_t:CDS:2, partial [Racocetra persica]
MGTYFADILYREDNIAPVLSRGFKNNTGSGTEGVSERHHQDKRMRSRGLDKGVISSMIKSRNSPTQRADRIINKNTLD